jgi:hypothetical protein
LAGQLPFVGSPLRIWLEDVTHTAKIDGTIAEGDGGITDPNRLRFRVFVTYRPSQPTCPKPTLGITKTPFRVGIADVLKKDPLSPKAVGCKTPIRMLGERRLTVPHGQNSNRFVLRPIRGKHPNLWLGGSRSGFQTGQCGIT